LADRKSTESLRGKFIVIDGPDGCGKSTQLELLGNYLRDKGLDVVSTYDPGGTKIGNQISRLLKYDAQGPMAPTTEVLLFMASRAQLVNEVIRPAIEQGQTVLCDRFVSATCAYQGSMGFPIQQILELARICTENLWPDLTIILDRPAEVGLERTGRKRALSPGSTHTDKGQGHLFRDAVVDRFDSRPLSYHRKVKKEFLRLPTYYPGPVSIIETAGLDIQSVQQRIIQEISSWITKG
jgi:dTMP kinase